MRACALLGVVLAACWTASPGPVTPPPAESVATPTPAPRRSRWRRSKPRIVAVPRPDPARTPDQVARELATELRSNGDALLPMFIAGPLVVLDLDSGALTVECDAAAASLALQYGQLLTDPTRAKPHCRGKDTFTCSQFSSQQILILELEDPDQWRLVSVIIGNFRSGRSTMHAKIGQMRSMVRTATCP